MPELPEVETVRRGLADHLIGRTVRSVRVDHPRATRRQSPGTDFGALAGQQILDVRRRGKYLWWALAPHGPATQHDPGTRSGDAVLAHLGMSGQLLVSSDGVQDQRHLRVRFTLDGAPDAPAQQLRFVDQRMFGGLSVSPGGAELPAEIAHIARDPVDPLFDDETFVTRVRRRRSGIKRILLDQTVVSGVGNIYADEALWRSRLHGDRLGTNLRRADVRGVLHDVRTVMAAALAEGGTSFDALYVNVNGQSGYFDRSLHAYGQQGRPCDRCGTAIVRVAFMNRSSYFCPHCQPPPRRRSTGSRKD